MEICFEIKNLKPNATENPGFHLIRRRGVNTFLFILFKSKGELECDGEKYEYVPNDIVIIKPYTPHSINTKENLLVHDWIHFTVDAEAAFTEKILPFNKIYHSSIGHNISEFIKLIYAEYVQGVGDTGFIIDCLMNAVFGLIAKDNQQLKKFTRTELQMKKRFDEIRNAFYLNQRFPETVKQVANDCFLSESRFSHLYKLFYGVSPKQDILAAKLQYAKQLLVSTRLSILEIALACGFSSEYTFIRFFKKQMGCSPRKWQK